MENDRFILNRNSDVKVIYIGTGQFQLASGKWVDAVMYCRDGNVYVRELLDFFLNFKCLEAKNPMPGDMYLRKQKTVTDIVQDQLGPGYVARGHNGGNPIFVEEVESDGSQNDLALDED